MATLTLNIPAFAKRQGCTTAYEFATASNLAYLPVKSWWEGNVRQIQLRFLHKILVALDAAPPGCFDWCPDEDGVPKTFIQEQKTPPFLVWRIRELALRRFPAESEMESKIAFARQARIFYVQHDASKPWQVEKYWNGTMQHVQMPTLGRIITTLGVEPGDIFTWTS